VHDRRRSTAGACLDPGWRGRQNQLGRVLTRVTGPIRSSLSPCVGHTCGDRHVRIVVRSPWIPRQSGPEP
jgi:hypothetical protein